MKEILKEIHFQREASLKVRGQSTGTIWSPAGFQTPAHIGKICRKFLKMFGSSSSFWVCLPGRNLGTIAQLNILFCTLFCTAVPNEEERKKPFPQRESAKFHPLFPCCGCRCCRVSKQTSVTQTGLMEPAPRVAGTSCVTNPQHF